MTIQVQIASAPDRAHAFVEILMDGKFVALVAYAEQGPVGRLEIEFPGDEVSQELVLRTIDLDTFLRAVSDARAALQPAPGQLQVERLRVAASLGDEAAIQATGAPVAWWPQDPTQLEEWFDFVARDPELCARFMLGLARSMLPTWRSSPHAPRDDDTFEQVLAKGERALEGGVVSEDEWAELESRVSALFDVADGVLLRPGLMLDAIVTAYLALVCTRLYDDGVALRRSRLATMATTAQAVAEQPGFDRGPFAETARDVARWLLR